MFIPNLGPSVYSAFYAGRLQFAEVTSWYEPVLTSLDDLSVLQNDPFANPYFKKIEELTRAALARCGDRYWVGYTDLHPSLDCIAAWRGIDALCLDMAVEPEKLAPLVELSVRDFHRIFDHFDAMLKSAGQPSGTWINIPCAGKLHIPSCDVSTMISTAHFTQFSLPQLRARIAGHGPRHLSCGRQGCGPASGRDSGAARHPGHPVGAGHGRGLAHFRQWVPLLKRILAAGKSVLVDVPMEELDEFMKEMPREGVFLCLGVREGEEAETLRRVERWGKTMKTRPDLLAGGERLPVRRGHARDLAETEPVHHLARRHNPRPRVEGRVAHLGRPVGPPAVTTRRSRSRRACASRGRVGVRLGRVLAGEGFLFRIPLQALAGAQRDGSQMADRGRAVAGFHIADRILAGVMHSKKLPMWSLLK